MVGLQWTSEAKKWLHDIHSYISQDNPLAAEKVINGIIEKAEMLREFPEIGQLIFPEMERGLRMLLYGHYRIVYLLDKSGKNISIIGVYHGSLDIQSRLKTL